MDQHLELFAALAAPFDHEEVRLRPQAGRQIPYITARTVMNRLDDVLGPANWWDEYAPLENSVICRLTIRLPDGTTLTKSDAGGYAGMTDSGDDDKSGFSDAFKRAAVKFGVGRYLYRDGVPRFVKEASRHSVLTQGPGEHTPAAAHSPADAPQSAAPSPNVARDHGPPESGKALFAWIKHHDEVNGSALLLKISEWARQQNFPARMIQWNADQVRRGFAQARVVLDGLPPRPTSPPSLTAKQSPSTDQATSGSSSSAAPPATMKRGSTPGRSGKGR
jgi:hypothetical protein